MTYKIIRFYRDGPAREVITSGLTLAEAQRWCSDPETSSSSATGRQAVERTAAYGPWFDGYEEEE